MRNYPLLITLFASLAASACNQTECGTGTIERDGTCQPATVQTDPGMCGPFTELQGDRCAPQFPPTECDPSTTMPNVDPDTGVVTCIGTGGGGCDTPIACPAPTGSTKITICGQFYDFQDNTKFAESGGASGNCDPASPTTSGPCALQLLAFDAYAFGSNPQTAQPLAVDSVTIDKCGRYRVAGIETSGTGPFIGLGIDDGPPGTPLGPTGVTVTVGVAAAKADGPAIQGFEAWIVKATTVGAWQASGGPMLATGIYAPVYRKHKKGNGDPFEPQGAGVEATKDPNGPIATGPSGPAFYFDAAETMRTTIDTNNTTTGANSTVLITGASVNDSVVYGGQNGLGPGCLWQKHAGASIPGIVFIQVFRKDNIFGQTCND
jgi:hypothetical protein